MWKHCWWMRFFCRSETDRRSQSRNVFRSRGKIYRPRLLSTAAAAAAAASSSPFPPHRILLRIPWAEFTYSPPPKLAQEWYYSFRNNFYSKTFIRRIHSAARPVPYRIAEIPRNSAATPRSGVEKYRFAAIRFIEFLGFVFFFPYFPFLVSFASEKVNVNKIK